MIFNSERCTVKHPKASKQCRYQAQRKKAIIWNVLVVLGPLREEAPCYCYIYKLRIKTLTLASSGVIVVAIHWVGGSVVTYNATSTVVRTNP